MLGSSLLLSALVTFSHAANLVEVLTQHGATKLVDLAVKAGLADTLTGGIQNYLAYKGSIVAQDTLFIFDPFQLWMHPINVL